MEWQGVPIQKKLKGQTVLFKAIASHIIKCNQMSPVSHVVIPIQLLAWSGEMQPYTDHLSTYELVTGLINKPG